MGIVIAYRGSGVINFAQGAFAMIATMFFVDFRNTGDFVIPWAGLPSRFHIMDDPPTIVALVAALGLAAIIGLLCHMLVFRPLADSPPLARVVASVGVLLTLQALAILRFGSGTKTSKSMFPSDTFSLLGVDVPRDRLFIAGTIMVLALLLWVAFQRTMFGLTTRAAASNPRATTLLGYSSGRVAALNWMLASVVGAFAGILVSPITSVNATTATLFVVPALAAALVGRLSSFGVTAAAGLGLGALQSVVILLQRESWFPGFLQTGVREAIPFLAIVLGLFLLGDKLPTRGDEDAGRLPMSLPARNRLIPLVIGVPVAVVALVLFDGLTRFSFIHSMVMAILLLSLVVLTGFTGQISLGQAALAGVAGFTLARIGDNLPFPIAPIGAALIATVVGILIGIPALRIRGVQLAVVTIAGAAAIGELMFKNESFTGGIKGARVPDPSVGALNLSITDGGTFPTLAFGLFALVVLVFMTLAVVNLRLGMTGFRLLAVRSNERAAAALGVNVGTTKMYAFGISSFIAAVGGVMLGYERVQLSVGSFDVFVGLIILAYAYVGGISSAGGALTGAAILSGGIVSTLIAKWVEFPAEYQLLIGGLALILTAVFNPEGIVGGIQLARRQRADRARAKTEQTHLSDEPELFDVDDVVEEQPPVRSSPIVDAVATRRPPSSASDIVLRVRSLTVDYGGVRALDSLDLSIRRGTLTGLIGPNGAGKTTCIDALTGFVPNAVGTVEFNGLRVYGLAPHQLARLGIVRTFQAVELFEELTVAENLAVAATRPRWWAPLADLVVPHLADRGQDKIERALDLLEISDLADRYPRDLSTGQSRLVGVARALTSSPDLLLLDEPAAGLDTAETMELGGRLARILADGTTILLVDHDMGLVLSICDELTVLDFGKRIAVGTPAQIQADEAVIDAYLGAAHTHVGGVNDAATKHLVGEGIVDE